MHLGTLRTGIVEIERFNEPLEGGQFEIEVYVPVAEIDASGSPLPFVMREIAIHLAKAMKETNVPREHWWFYPTQETQRRFNMQHEKVPMA